MLIIMMIGKWMHIRLTIDNYYEVNSAFTIGFGLRYYTQSEAEFYSDNINFFTTQTIASMDKKVSDFDAMTYKLSVTYKQNEELSYDVGINYYDQSTDLSATYFSAGIKYKF